MTRLLHHSPSSELANESTSPISLPGKWTRRPERVVLVGAVVAGEDKGVEDLGRGSGEDLVVRLDSESGYKYAGLRRSRETLSFRPLSSRVKYLSVLSNTLNGPL